ncbi:hypothetical protein O1W68_07705 [Rhodococcus sp. H36-A4]|uniref:hypothetical protein n=1 Tax=Rhodococcus sp. H36-A4 TaxID=3004353 RepID=UPI0022AF687F|nr:hypothetical protein [Rhodococcus sp. H36-A4]MCZ4077820.1 hypothetical protein [Rhodococcus sp. H36-A4]
MHITEINSTDRNDFSNEELTSLVRTLYARTELLMDCYRELAEDVDGAHGIAENINERLAGFADILEEGDNE